MFIKVLEAMVNILYCLYSQDQGNEMAQSRSSQCRCDFCCIEESPIVAADGLLFKCCLKGESYIPTEVVEFNELIRSLQKRVSAIETRRRTLSVSIHSFLVWCYTVYIYIYI